MVHCIIGRALAPGQCYQHDVLITHGHGTIEHQVEYDRFTATLALVALVIVCNMFKRTRSRGKRDAQHEEILLDEMAMLAMRALNRDHRHAVSLKPSPRTLPFHNPLQHSFESSAPAASSALKRSQEYTPLSPESTDAILASNGGRMAHDQQTQEKVQIPTSPDSTMVDVSFLTSDTLHASSRARSRIHRRSREDNYEAQQRSYLRMCNEVGGLSSSPNSNGSLSSQSPSSSFKQSVHEAETAAAHELLSLPQHPLDGAAAEPAAVPSPCIMPQGVFCTNGEISSRPRDFSMFLTPSEMASNRASLEKAGSGKLKIRL